MSNIVIYSTNYCPYCKRAKDLFKSKGVEFKEIDVGEDEDMRNKMIANAKGQRTVPQIFIDDWHVGGFDDLSAMDRQGKLDKMLGIKKRER